ncbi:DUF2059 domain-containing protein [Caulobacter sp. 17J65-9]|uniref:DUF2059 domain-containing protein n=1 Tax=Caulobacter sp. 17J65-9 TaxID=2709382 RepID=UPI0013C732E8|nr:DUF2059 domain-containing protein [Caulobacter sp. 17J65-9]NEX91301.1 DUF2059 domain-containing protein [Caulobacter sp. 17J65-9]
MKRLVSAVVVCAALLVSSTVAAAESPSGAQAAPAATARATAGPGVDARKLELSRRYFKAINVETKLRTLSESMFSAMTAKSDSVSPEVRQAMMESMSEASVAGYRAIEEHYVLMVAGVFSAEELQAMVDFYESPVGQSVLAKGNQLAARSGELMQEMTPTIMTEYETRFCAKTKREAGCLTKSAGKS